VASNRQQPIHRAMIHRYAYLAWIRLRLKRFLVDARKAQQWQHRALMSKIRRNAASDFGRDHGFASIRSADEFRRRQPLATYDEHHPYISRVLDGDVTALFAPNTRVLMFAMTSGTTGQPKRLPITRELFDEYKAGWRIWGGGVYGDHIDLVHKRTLQISSDWQQHLTPSGVPCGQISGLAATTRPWITQRVFLPPPAVSQIHDSTAKHYTALRLALATDRVGMIVTANPSTLVEFARHANREAESLIRDIHDGTLSCEISPSVRRRLSRHIARRQPQRAQQLEKLADRHDGLWPRYAWPNLSVLAVWLGGSVSVYLPQLKDLYGLTAIRDHGLSASEGRMTIPLSDGTSAGLLDFYNTYFEFIPVAEHEDGNPTVLEAHELVEGEDYYIVLTTSGGLYRYDIHDVVRCVGYEGQAPYLEFLNKGRSFSSLTGEKLSEHQVIQAVKMGFQELQLPLCTFTLAPIMDGKPRYVLLLEPQAHRGHGAELAEHVHANLMLVNEEYRAKCASGRLLPVRVREVADGTWDALRRDRTKERGNFEEYKHPCLVGDLRFIDRVAALDRPSLQLVSA
jgi:hypothetical protein